MAENIYEFAVTTIDKKELPLSEYKGAVVLIVNTASKCGFTPQYKGLQELYEKYKDKGFVVLGFPCNQFANQEPGNEDEIQSFCELNYGVNFPMFSKVDVNGTDAHPLFKYLTETLPGIAGTKSIKWNFTKFLVNREGVPVARFGSNKKPEKLEAEISRLL